MAKRSLQVILRFGVMRRPQILENREGESGEQPLNEHVEGGDEERVREIKVVGAKHPFVWERKWSGRQEKVDV